MNDSSRNLTELLEIYSDKLSFMEFVGGMLEDSSTISTLDYNILRDKAIELRCKTAFEKAYSEHKAQRNEHNPNVPPYIVYRNGCEVVSPERLADYIADTEHYICVQPHDSDDKQLYWYNGKVYKPTSASTAKGIIKSIVSDYNRELATVRVIEDTYKQIGYSLDKHFIEDGERLDSREELITFENGVLNLDTMNLDTHSPEVLSTIMIPCKWSSSAKSTPIFDKFIEHLARGESEAARTLMEYIGFALTNINVSKFKQALFLIGSGDSGKSQFVELIEKLIGFNNCCTLPFDKLEGRFQAANLYHKRVASDKDCRAVGSGEIAVFKTITGGDRLQGEAKGKMPFYFTYRGAYVVCANEVPLFGGDRGEHVYRRILPIMCGDSLPKNKQDKRLLEKLYDEREGIVHKCVMALKAAIDDNYTFTEGANTKQLRARYKLENDVTLKFLEECCEDTTTAKAASTTAQVWLAFTQWCKINHEYQPTRSAFTKSLCQRYECKEYQLIKKSGNTRYYPCTLKEESKAELGVYDSINAEK